MTTVYIAGPYTHNEDNVKELRYTLLSQISMHFMKRQQDVFSPITHGHAMEEQTGEVCDYKWWIIHGLKNLQRCDHMYVCELPGSDNSTGVEMEIMWCQANGIPYSFISPEQIKAMLEVDANLVNVLQRLEDDPVVHL